MNGLTAVPSWLETVIGPKLGSDFMKILQTAPLEQREGLLKQAIIQELKNVLGQSQVLDENKGFFEMGMDSLMALELKNRLQTLIEKVLPNTLIFDYPSINMLTQYIAETLGIRKKQITPEEAKDKIIDSMSSKDLWESAKKEIDSKGSD